MLSRLSRIFIYTGISPKIYGYVYEKILWLMSAHRILIISISHINFSCPAKIADCRILIFFPIHKLPLYHKA